MPPRLGLPCATACCLLPPPACLPACPPACLPLSKQPPSHPGPAPRSNRDKYLLTEEDQGLVQGACLQAPSCRQEANVNFEVGSAECSCSCSCLPPLPAAALSPALSNAPELDVECGEARPVDVLQAPAAFLLPAAPCCRSLLHPLAHACHPCRRMLPSGPCFCCLDSGRGHPVRRRPDVCAAAAAGQRTGVLPGVPGHARLRRIRLLYIAADLLL